MKKLTALILSVSLTATLGVSAVSASAAADNFNYSAWADTYMPETGIALPPVVVFKVESAYDLNALNTEKSPSVAMFTVNDNGEVVGSDNEKIAELAEAVRACNNKVIPAFRFETAAASEKVHEFIDLRGVVDSMIFSSNAQLISDFKELRPQTNAGLILQNVDCSDTAKVCEAKNSVNEARALIALLEGGYTVDAVETLQHLGLTVWTDIPETEYDVYKALYAGVNGIVSNNFSMPIDVMETFDTPTLIRTPYLSAHRGSDSNKYGENSIMNAKHAYLMGADYVELDVMRTKDDQLIVMHDDTLNRTTDYTGTAKVVDMTLEEISQYKIKVNNKGTYAIPTVEDFFDLAKELPDMKLLVELKADDAEVVPILVQKIKAAGVEDNIIVIANWDGSRLQELKELLPNVCTNSTQSYRTLDAATYNAWKNGNSGGGGVMWMQNSAKMPQDDIKMLLSQLSVRGIPTITWTYQTVSDFENYMFYTNTLTSDYISYAKSQVLSLDIDYGEMATTFTEATTQTVAATAYTRERTGIKAENGRKTVANASVTLATAENLVQSDVSYANLVSYRNGTLTINGSKEGAQIIWFEYEYENAITEVSYTVMSEPILLACGGVDTAAYTTAVSQEEYMSENETPDDGGNETPDDGGNETPDDGGNETPDDGGNEIPDDGDEEESGCGSFTGVGIVAGLALAGALVALKKKEY